METDQCTHPRVFNLSACPSTHWTDPYLPLETAHITHQVPYHYTKLTPILLHTNPIYSDIFDPMQILYFATSYTLPSKSHFIYRDTHAYKQPPPLVPTLHTGKHSYYLRKISNTHLGIGKNCKSSTLNRPTCWRAPYFIYITCHSVHKTSSLKEYL
jgi:hypothetical protein